MTSLELAQKCEEFLENKKGLDISDSVSTISPEKLFLTCNAKL